MSDKIQGNKDFWEFADQFRIKVCSELRNLSIHERLSLQGDYLFTIDNIPRFIVMVAKIGAFSIVINKSEQSNQSEIQIFDFKVDADCPWDVTPVQVINVVEGSARSHISTDSLTLYKLLHGTLKARIAFVTSKVTITGDLPAFLKMASLLKKRGIRPGVQTPKIGSIV